SSRQARIFLLPAASFQRKKKSSRPKTADTAATELPCRDRTPEPVAQRLRPRDASTAWKQKPGCPGHAVATALARHLPVSVCFQARGTCRRDVRKTCLRHLCCVKKKSILPAATAPVSVLQ